MNGNAHYRRLLRRWRELMAIAPHTKAERAELAQIEAELAEIEMGWGR